MNITLYRIIRAPKSNDGWIVQNALGRIGFIANLSQIIGKLIPGDQWAGEIVESHPTYDLVKLTSKLQ